MQDNLSFNEDELYKQAVQEIEAQEHSICIHIAVPNITLESMLETKKDILPVADVHSGEGGVNSMTRAMAVIVLKEVTESMLNDTNTKEAYQLLQVMTKTKQITLHEEEREVKDSDTN